MKSTEQAAVPSGYFVGAAGSADVDLPVCPFAQVLLLRVTEVNTSRRLRAEFFSRLVRSQPFGEHRLGALDRQDGSQNDCNSKALLGGRTISFSMAAAIRM